MLASYSLSGADEERFFSALKKAGVEDGNGIQFSGQAQEFFVEPRLYERYKEIFDEFNVEVEA